VLQSAEHRVARDHNLPVLHHDPHVHAHLLHTARHRGADAGEDGYHIGEGRQSQGAQSWPAHEWQRVSGNDLHRLGPGR
jgi:hypothetical protein